MEFDEQRSEVKSDTVYLCTDTKHFNQDIDIHQKERYMPKLLDKNPMQTHNTVSQFQFSAVDIKSLGASEYTIVTVVQDTSTSVGPFRDDMEKTLKQIVEACRKSPRSENLLLRLVEFNSTIGELHGFRELRNIDPKEYDGILNPRGMTALYDATADAVEATEQFAKTLVANDYPCNAIMFVITDGDENSSHAVKSARVIKDAVKRIYAAETLESFKSVLVGVGNDPDIMVLLQHFKDEAGLDQFVEMGAATPQRLAKLADFVSKSVSSTSQALGTGKPSQPLTF